MIRYRPILVSVLVLTTQLILTSRSSWAEEGEAHTEEKKEAPKADVPKVEAQEAVEHQPASPEGRKKRRSPTKRKKHKKRRGPDSAFRTKRPFFSAENRCHEWKGRSPQNNGVVEISSQELKEMQSASKESSESMTAGASGIHLGLQEKSAQGVCGVMQDFMGKVEILDSTRTKILDSNINASFNCGSWVSVKSGWAQIRYRDGQKLRLGHDTLIQVLGMDDQVRLYRGLVLVEVNLGSGEFRVANAVGVHELNLERPYFFTPLKMILPNVLL
jgi:hypothetical protein